MDYIVNSRARNWMELHGFVPSLIPDCTEFARIWRTARAMATIIHTQEGTWRAQVRRKGKYSSQTFRLKTQAGLSIELTPRAGEKTPDEFGE